mgnify:CR=1 FL=1
MITLKCGNCGMEYNLDEKSVAAGQASIKCPNCRTQIPQTLAGSLGDFARAITSEKSGNWKVSASNFNPESKLIKVEGSLTLK